MTAATQVTSVVMTRYAVSLADLADEAKISDKVEADILSLEAMIADSDHLAEVIRSPVVPKAEQMAAMLGLAEKAKFQKLTANFLGVLVQNRRLDIVGGIIIAFKREMSKRRGEVVVRLQVASPMSAKQEKDYKDSIAKALGRDVILQVEVDPQVIGGTIVTVGSCMIDDSVRRKLERLRIVLGSETNENNQTNISEVA